MLLYSRYSVCPVADYSVKFSDVPAVGGEAGLLRRGRTSLGSTRERPAPLRYVRNGQLVRRRFGAKRLGGESRRAASFVPKKKGCQP